MKNWEFATKNILLKDVTVASFMNEILPHLKCSPLVLLHIFHPLFNHKNEMQQKLLSYSTKQSYYLLLSICSHFFTLPLFTTSIFLLLFFTFVNWRSEESQIFHSHGCGRIPSTWLDSINIRWFAFLKLGKHTALCNTRNAFCINLVIEYIFKNPACYGILSSASLLQSRSNSLLLYIFEN